MTGMHEEGAPLPDRSNERWQHKVIAPKGKLPLTVVFLDKAITGFWTHWDGRALPCSRDHRCTYCNAGLGNRWTGYAAVYALEVRGERVLAVTENAARKLMKFIKTENGLRGMRFILQRTGDRPNSPVDPRFLRMEDPERVPPAFNIRDDLNRMWGINDSFHQRSQHPSAQLRGPIINPNESHSLRSDPTDFTRDVADHWNPNGDE